jgi:uncharacterized membrane protein YgdD (TMEM256/DUF423 family)
MRHSSGMNRFLTIAGALCGAAGVALSAAAAHAGGGNLGTAATMLLAHAPVLVAVGLAGKGRALGWAALLLLAGVLLFAGDLLARHWLGGRLFPFAAPAGGVAMIAGWLAIAVAALIFLPEEDR